MTADINIAYQEYVCKLDPESLDRLIAEGGGIVRHFSELYGQGLDRDDLFQTGVIGLLKAAKSYDAACGSAFSTWAAVCVISEIRHFVRREAAYRQPILESAVDPQTDGALVGAPPQESPLPQSELDTRIMLEEAAGQLGNLQRRVIDALFFKGMTQQQTADEIGLSQRRVSRIKCGAVKKLRALLDTGDSFRLVDSKYSFKLIGQNDKA